jgi:hypothetical protein
MRFGLFGGARTKRPTGVGLGDSHSYQGFIDYVVEAERLGFHSVFLVEHHFTGQGQVSASMTLLAYLAAKTSRIRLGTAVVVLPWHNPVLVAEQAATLDLLSGGRFDFGVGKGYRKAEFAGFRIPVEEAAERFDEAMEVIRKAWTSEGRFSHHGRRWRYDDIVVEPDRCSAPTRRSGSPPGARAQSAARRAKDTTCCSTRSLRRSRSSSASRCSARNAPRPADPTIPRWSAWPAPCSSSTTKRSARRPTRPAPAWWNASATSPRARAWTSRSSRTTRRCSACRAR